jgi:DNA-binding winged helix-turn-helix (wHTH) protein
MVKLARRQMKNRFRGAPLTLGSFLITSPSRGAITVPPHGDWSRPGASNIRPTSCHAAVRLANVHPSELVNRVIRLEALLCQRRIALRATNLKAGPLQLDLIERTAQRDARAIDLLPREFRLLKYMMQHNNRVLSRKTLLAEVWNYKVWNYKATPKTNLVDVHIGRLRHKVDGSGEMPLIYTVRGAGFILTVPD